MSGPGKSSLDLFGPCAVELAKILEVYPDCYSARIITLHTNRDIPDVKFAVPVLHDSEQHQGSGLNFMPQPDDLCYVFTPADESGPFILGFVYLGKPESVMTLDGSKEDQKSFRGVRPRLEPGDISLTSSDDNFVIVRRGGVVQIGANSMAQSLYIPLENIIRHYFQKYQSFSPIGEVVWDHATVSTDNFPMPGKGSPDNADIPTMVKFSCREKIQDKKMTVEFRVGRLNKDMLDLSLDSNLVNAGKEQEIEVVSNKDDVKAGKAVILEPEKQDAGDDGEMDHLFCSQQKHPGLGLIPDHAKFPGLMSVIISPAEGEGDSAIYPVKYTFQIDGKGNNFIRSEAHVHWEVEKGLFVSTSQDDGFRVIARDKKGATPDSDSTASQTTRWIELNDNFRAHVKDALIEILSSANINISTKNGNITLSCPGGTFKVDANNVVISSKTGIHLDTSDTIKLGDGANGLATMTSSELTSLLGHQHVCPTAMGFSGVPADTTASLTATMPVSLASGHTSATGPKIKVP